MKKVMYQFLMSCLVLSMVVSCSNTDDNLKSYYTIESEEDDNNLDAARVTVRLEQKVSLDTLTLISRQIHENYLKYNRTYLFYLLPGMEKGKGAWAGANYTPNEEVQIFGSEKSTDEGLLNADVNVDGEIVGKYYNPNSSYALLIVFKVKDKYFIKKMYEDGSEGVDELAAAKVSNGIKLVDPDNVHGEYMILTENSLDDYNKEGKRFATNPIVSP